MNKIRCILLGFCFLFASSVYSYTFEYKGWLCSLIFDSNYNPIGVYLLEPSATHTDIYIPDWMSYTYGDDPFIVNVCKLRQYCFARRASESGANLVSWKFIKDATRADLPSTVTEIGSSMFYGNTAIEIVDMPASLDIPESTFEGCTSLKEVFWRGATQIGAKAFKDCTSLKSMPSSQITIFGSYSFYNTGIENFSFSNQTAYIDKYAFENVTKPKILALPNSLKTIGIGAFRGCSNLSLVSFGDGEVTVDARAFQGCTNLKYIVIGKALTSIGNLAFYDCSNIQEIYISNPTPPTVGANLVFPNEVKKNATLYVPVGSFFDYWSAPEWEDFNIVEKDFEPIVSIDVQDKFDVVKDTRVRLPYTITPTTASIPNLQFTSSDTFVAEVSSDGFVQGKKAGTATITIISQDGTNIVSECQIIVAEPTITEFKLNTKSLVLQVNEQTDLSVTVKPDNTNKSVTWSSANNEIAVVKEKDGVAKVLARAVGETDIIVQSVEYPEISDTCHVVVVEDNNLTGDVNEDGLVDKTDANTLIDMLLNRVEKSESADVNKDGVVNGLDFIILTKKIR